MLFTTTLIDGRFTYRYWWDKKPVDLETDWLVLLHFHRKHEPADF